LADRKTGEFEIDDVPDGSYKAEAFYGDGQTSFMGSAPVVVAGADVDSVRIVITRGTEVRGRLIWEGKPVAPAVQIDLAGKDETQQFTAQTESDGTFSIRGIPDGLYKFRTFSECNSCYLKSATVEGVDVLKNGLHVSSGAAPSAVELVYSTKAGSIDGTVLGPDGSPAQGAIVLLVSDVKELEPGLDDWEPNRIQSTDQYGHFVFGTIPPGSYYAYSWQKLGGMGSYLDPDVLKQFEQQATTATVSEGEKKTLQLTLLPDPAGKQ
jgi:hypothetical protein